MLTTFHIKLIAMTTMVIDHVGLLFFPEILILRFIGRLSFPLFAWLIANGARHTSNEMAYLKRLFVLAIISQLPYILMLQEARVSPIDLNIFVTLFVGLAAVICFKRAQAMFFRITIIAAAALAASFSDYGAAGVLSIITFYVFFKNIRLLFVLQALIFMWFYIAYPILYQHFFTPLQALELSPVAVVQPFAVVSLIFIALYSGKEGPKLKKVFYPFYPVHLLILWAIKVFM